MPVLCTDSSNGMKLVAWWVLCCKCHFHYCSRSMHSASLQTPKQTRVMFVMFAFQKDHSLYSAHVSMDHMSPQVQYIQSIV